MIVNEAQAGGEVALAPGEELTVRLRENPGTGYRWAVDSAAGLQLEGEHNEVGAAPGGAGVREFHFRAGPAGDHELRLKQWRAWQGEAGVVERFSLRVRIAAGAEG